MKVWRIGSKLGDYDLLTKFKDYNIAFAAQEKIRNVEVGDIIAVTTGQIIKAVGKVKGALPLSVCNEEFAKDYDDVIALSIEPYFFAEDYNVDFGKYGGQGKQFHEAHGIYTEEIANLFFRISKETKK
jgi:hypothetical protein